MAVSDAHVFPGLISHTSINTTFSKPTNYFSHVLQQVRGENMLERNFASVGSRTHNHQVKCGKKEKKILVALKNKTKLTWTEKGEFRKNELFANLKPISLLNPLHHNPDFSRPHREKTSQNNVGEVNRNLGTSTSSFSYVFPSYREKISIF